jgi:alkanesulfonate monooxygenase SsuD/methylene tetrahydromethanopterin reductase-like flavin-dependent oxidoreductase (luciferase family)
MRALWTQEEASYKGEHAQIEPSWAWPKPVQQPYPRILVGAAAGPLTFAGIADHADGWMPIGGRGLRASLPLLQEAYDKAGRDPATIQIVPVGVVGDDTVEGKLAHFAELGITETVLQLPLGDESELMHALDRYTRLLG